MPYIPQQNREVLDPLIKSLSTKITALGEFNYVVTKLCLNYLSHQTEIRYSSINDLIGVLECAKLEFYRRLAMPYEDSKIKQNGDVFKITQDIEGTKIQ